MSVKPIQQPNLTSGSYYIPPLQSSSAALQYSQATADASVTRKARITSHSQDDVAEKALRFDGYPRFLQFAASSGDAFVLRRFNKLNARMIYSMQAEIVELEDELEALDQNCMRGGDFLRHKYDPSPRRVVITKTLRELLRSYNEYVLAYSELRKRSSAQEFQVKNIENWFKKHPQDINPSEQRFIDTEDDLISIIAETKSWMRLAIEMVSPAILSRLFPTKRRRNRPNDENSFYVSNQGMDATMTFVIVSIGLGVLLGPMWWLNKLSDATPNTDNRLWVITGCVIFFTIVLAAATVRRPFEVLVGTAGYAAVLMVFMQLQSNS